MFVPQHSILLRTTDRRNVDRNSWSALCVVAWMVLSVVRYSSSVLVLRGVADLLKRYRKRNSTQDN